MRKTVLLAVLQSLLASHQVNLSASCHPGLTAIHSAKGMSSQKAKKDHDKARRLVARWDRRPFEQVLSESKCTDEEINESLAMLRSLTNLNKASRELQNDTTSPVDQRIEEERELEIRAARLVERQKSLQRRTDGMTNSQKAQIGSERIENITRLMTSEERKRENWWREAQKEKLGSKHPQGKSDSTGKKA